MKKRHKILFDLTDAAGGYAGIPQESHLTFSILAHHRLFKGFIHTITFKEKLEKIRRFLAHQRIDPVQLSYGWLMHIYGKILTLAPSGCIGQ
jgi:hypothetical protein